MSCDPCCEYEPRYNTTRSGHTAEQLKAVLDQGYDAEDSLKLLEAAEAVLEVYIYDICPNCGDTVSPSSRQAATITVSPPNPPKPEPETPQEPWHNFGGNGTSSP